MNQIVLVVLLFVWAAAALAQDPGKDSAETEAAVAACLGVNILSITPDLKESCASWNLSDFEDGVVIFMIGDDSPAAMAGLRPSDVIYSINGIRVARSSDVVALVSAASVGDEFQAVIFRNGERVTAKGYFGGFYGRSCTVAVAAKENIQAQLEETPSNNPLEADMRSACDAPAPQLDR